MQLTWEEDFWRMSEGRGDFAGEDVPGNFPERKMSGNCPRGMSRCKKANTERESRINIYAYSFLSAIPLAESAGLKSRQTD